MASRQRHCHQAKLCTLPPPPPPPPPPRSSCASSPNEPFCINCFHFLQLNVCSSDKDPLDPKHQGKEALKIVIITPRCLWFLHGHMVPVLCPKSMREVPSGLEPLLNLFSVFRNGRAAQILFLEFSKDGPANVFWWFS